MRRETSTAEKDVGFVRQLRPTLGELALALAEPFTFDVARNVYLWLGAVVGLPLPIFSLGVDLAMRGAPLTLGEIAMTVASRPAHLWFLLQPVLLALVFGAFGTVRREKERQILSLILDLEERLREVREAHAQVVKLDDAKRRLIANVSHELKTPLTSIRGYAEVLRTGRLGELDRRQSKALDVVLRAVDRERALVEDLLCYARLESHQYHLDRETFDVRAAAQAARENLLVEASRRGVSLVLTVPEEPAFVYADRAGIEHVLTNLVSNAVKFSPEGGRAELCVEDREGRVSVTVTDTGPGIPPKERQRVFERFYQLDDGDTREHGGTGLGLPIVKGILDAHDAKIDLDQAPGGGARFRFSLAAVEGARDTATRSTRLRAA